MSADLAISYLDGTEDIWVPVSPQSVLTNEWLPIAQHHGWRWIELLCNNTCQVFDQTGAEELLAELQALQTRVESNRLPPVISAVELAVAKWEKVKPPLLIG